MLDVAAGSKARAAAKARVDGEFTPVDHSSRAAQALLHCTVCNALTPTAVGTAGENHDHAVTNLGAQHLKRHHIGGRLARWRAKSHFGKAGQKAAKLGFFWWLLGIVLFIANWVWLQFFVLGYMSWATTPTLIAAGVLIFDLSEAIFFKLVRSVMRKAEYYRIGNHHETAFDRFHLTNLSIFAFECYKAIFRTSLFVNVDSWAGIVPFYVINLVGYGFSVALPMSDLVHNLNNKHINQFFQRRDDILHQRGMICYGAFLRNRANTTASFQYICFIVVFLTLAPYNIAVFPQFSEAANFDAKQQLLFVLAEYVLDRLNYELLNRWCAKHYEISPFYVGQCHTKDYPRTEAALTIISIHIVRYINHATMPSM
eukprot:COSAG02_NODE_6446_length_3564_cov_2.147475_2_plen_370_part_00